jgi:putative ABC transport system permease protein
MASLALKNLIYDKVRLTVTLVGIVFSVILSSVQLGLFVGFQTATADVIVHSNADIWITSKNLSNIEDGVPLSETKLYQVLATPGVKSATKQIVQFGSWKKAERRGYGRDARRFRFGRLDGRALEFNTRLDGGFAAAECGHR